MYFNCLCSSFRPTTPHQVIFDIDFQYICFNAHRLPFKLKLAQNNILNNHSSYITYINSVGTNNLILNHDLTGIISPLSVNGQHSSNTLLRLNRRLITKRDLIKTVGYLLSAFHVKRFMPDYICLPTFRFIVYLCLPRATSHFDLIPKLHLQPWFPIKD